MHHVKAPATIPRRFELAQVSHDVLADSPIGMGDITKIRILISRTTMTRVLSRMLLTTTALLDWRVGDPGCLVLKHFVGRTDRPHTPIGILEVGPSCRGIAVIDHDVGDWFHAVPEQLFEHRSVFAERPIAIVQAEILLRVVARTELTGERRWRQPDEVEPSRSYRGRFLPNDLIPGFTAEGGELLRVSVAVGLPVEALEHYAVVIEPSLGRDEPETGQE